MWHATFFVRKGGGINGKRETGKGKRKGFSTPSPLSGCPHVVLESTTLKRYRSRFTASSEDLLRHPVSGGESGCSVI